MKSGVCTWVFLAAGKKNPPKGARRMRCQREWRLGTGQWHVAPKCKIYLSPIAETKRRNCAAPRPCIGLDVEANSAGSERTLQARQTARGRGLPKGPALVAGQGQGFNGQGEALQREG